MTDPRIEAMARAIWPPDAITWHDYINDAERALEAYRAHPLSKLEAAVVDAAVQMHTEAQRRATTGDPYPLFKAVVALKAEREKQDD